MCVGLRSGSEVCSLRDNKKTGDEWCDGNKEKV